MQILLERDRLCQGYLPRLSRLHFPPPKDNFSGLKCPEIRYTIINSLSKSVDTCIIVTFFRLLIFVSFKCYFMYFYLNVYLLFYIRLKFVLDSPVTHTHITIFIIKTIFLRENKDVRNISIFFFIK